MFFWHIGLSISFFRFVFKDFSADLRCLIAGVLFPEFIYIFNTFVKINPEYPPYIGAYPEIGHTLFWAVATLIFVMIFSKRDTQRRKNSLLFAIGTFFHLLFDFMWLRQEVLFFPLQFDPSPERMPINLSVLFIQEVIGLSYLIPKLNSKEKVKRFLNEGII
jgi:hypothetical protein